MTLKHYSGSSLAALLAVMLAAPVQAAEDGKYVQNTAGEAVKNSADECVLAVFGSSPEGCEAAPAARPAGPAPATQPAPAAKPVPAPRARTVVPKVKVKGNYRGPVVMDPASNAAMQPYRKR